MQGLPNGYQAHIKRVGSVADLRVAPGFSPFFSRHFSDVVLFYHSQLLNCLLSSAVELGLYITFYQIVISTN